MWIVVPHQLVSAVAANVVKRLDRAVLGLDDDHGHTRARRRQLLGEIAAGAWQPLDSADVEPGALEDRLALGFEECRIDRVGVVDRSRSRVRDSSLSSFPQPVS